jgi:hypothetical protein
MKRVKEVTLTVAVRGNGRSTWNCLVHVLSVTHLGH